MAGTDWLHEIPLTGEAAQLRRELTPGEFQSVQRAIEMLSMTGCRPLVEITDRLFVAIVKAERSEMSALDLVHEIIALAEGQPPE